MTTKRKTQDQSTRGRKATAPPVNEDERRRIADLSFADQIDTLKLRCSAYELAAIGADYLTEGELGGISQLAGDLYNGMRQLAIAFEAERILRKA